ncbi:hypothetical protein HPB48_005252 [Haemaphysalis longicornis]|uniref:Endonuclease/exonuclease/phosphatase domain-containing protein n=1 Tax=Haemaphysalis longicornis TaxID=44386 RepID=A0A9J6FPA6_HAELO|nr:hypothetical protein HPB48_005252 [Haemaphysalis longicornis]
MRRGKKHKKIATTLPVLAHYAEKSSLTLIPSNMAVLTNSTTDAFQTKIWQWNCRSIRRKIANLLELTKKDQPDTIALQETYSTNIRLQNYNAFSRTERTTVRPKNTLTAQLPKIMNTNVDHTFFEILPDRKTQHSIFVLSVYSPPRDQLVKFEPF